MAYVWHRIALMLALLAIALPVQAQPVSVDDVPTVTPYRPSVSTPAALSAPGWIEAELGGLHAQGGTSARQDSVPYTIKLAFSPDWGVRLGGNAYIRNTDPDGNETSGFGDAAIILKRRFGIDDASAFGIEAGANIPTARAGLGSGKADYALNGIYSADLGTYHTDVNVLLTRIGALDPGQRHLQTGWAAALSRQLDDRWGVVGEFSGTRQDGAQSAAQFLVAASYSVSRMMVVDFGVTRGLTSASASWTVLTGITVLVARLF